MESESHSVVSDSLQPPGPYSPRNSPDQNTRVGSLSLLQGIFPTQGLNLGLPHCRWILYQLRHQGSPKREEGKCCDSLFPLLSPCARDPIRVSYTLPCNVLLYFTWVSVTWGNAPSNNFDGWVEECVSFNKGMRRGPMRGGPWKMIWSVLQQGDPGTFLCGGQKDSVEVDSGMF